MKKTFLPLLLLGIFSNSLMAQPIIFEEEVRTTKMTIINGGQVEKHGDVEIVRGPRERKQGRVRVGSRVITRDDREGTVVSMFISKNLVVVRDSYHGNRQWTLDEIAVTSGCLGVFCVNDRVITSDNRSGVVAGFFNDGTVVVKDSYHGYRQWPQRELAVTVGCNHLFCINDKVITSDDREGTVSGFYSNGYIAVLDSYHGYRTWREDEISITKGVCANIYVRRVNFCY